MPRLTHCGPRPLRRLAQTDIARRLSPRPRCGSVIRGEVTKICGGACDAECGVWVLPDVAPIPASPSHHPPCFCSDSAPSSQTSQRRPSATGATSVERPRRRLLLLPVPPPVGPTMTCQCCPGWAVGAALRRQQEETAAALGEETRSCNYRLDMAGSGAPGTLGGARGPHQSTRPGPSSGILKLSGSAVMRLLRPWWFLWS